MDLYAELLRIVDAFEQAGVEYAICGGLALAVHGYPRATKDIGLLLRDEDGERAFELIRDLGFAIDAGITSFGEGTRNERHLRRVSKVAGNDLLTVDILLTGSVHGEVWRSRRVYGWNERRVTVVSREGLIAMKKLSGRTQDLADLEKLER